MSHKLKIVLLFCLSITSVFATSSIKDPTFNTTTKTIENISPELVLHFLSEGLEIINLIEKIDPESQKKIGVFCDGCQKFKLSCAELSGHLSAQEDQESLDQLKKLLTKSEVQEINAYLLNTANKKQIACPMCEEFVKWQLND